MEAFSDLAEAICEAMLAHYQGKWDLFLRGLTPPQLSLFPRPAMPGPSVIPAP